jgi:NAD(P)-dependent dehydrogenase (short-subunit alcohol dehydrogenase family)
MQIEGMAAVVTGGGSGLGEAVAHALAARGARVGVLDLGIDAAQRVAAASDGLALACDVAHDAGGARRMIDKSGRPAPLADFRRTVR